MFFPIRENGYSGAYRNVSPSLSQVELVSDSLVTGIDALSDSGTTSGNERSKIIDGNTATFWKANSNANEYIVFDLKSSMRLTGLAIRVPGDSSKAANSCKLEYASAASGPWLTALNFQPLQASNWQYFAIPRCAPPGGCLTYDGSQWVCICEDGYSGDSCETSPSSSFTSFARGSIAGHSVHKLCDWNHGTNRGTYACDTTLSVWSVIAAPRYEDCSDLAYHSYYAQYDDRVCTCATGWTVVKYANNAIYAPTKNFCVKD